MVGFSARLVFLLPLGLLPILAFGSWWFGFRAGRVKASVLSLLLFATVGIAHGSFMRRHLESRAFVKDLQIDVIAEVRIAGRRLEGSEVERLVMALQGVQWYAENHDVWDAPKVMTIRLASGESRSFIIDRHTELPGAVVYFCSSTEGEAVCSWGAGYSVGLAEFE